MALIFVTIGHAFYEFFLLLMDVPTREISLLSLMGIVDMLGVAIVCAGVYGGEYTYGTMERTLTIEKDRRKLFVEKLLRSAIMSAIVIAYVWFLYSVGAAFSEQKNGFTFAGYILLILPVALLNPMLYWGPVWALWLKSSVHGVLATVATLGSIYTIILVVPALLSIMPETLLYNIVCFVLLIGINVLGLKTLYNLLMRLEV